jgi:hypothetical protein
MRSLGLSEDRREKGGGGEGEPAEDAIHARDATVH